MTSLPPCGTEPRPDLPDVLARARRIRRRRTLGQGVGVLALVAIAFPVVAAGGTGGRPIDVAQQPSTPPASSDVRKDLEGLGRHSAYLSRAQSVLVSRCMDEHGFAFPAEPDRPQVPRDRAYGLTVAEAERSGYVTQSQVLAVPQVRGDALAPSDPEAREAFYEALFGGDDPPTVEVPDPVVGGTVGTSSLGCIADAQRALFGSIEGALRWSVSAHLISRGESDARADPAYVELNRQWSDCMADAGRAGLADPAAANGRARALTGSDLGAMPKGEARAIAVDDATCQRDLDYAPQRQRLEERYLALVADRFAAEIAEIQEITRAALPRARAVLADDEI